MCCIFTCCGWLLDLIQRLWTFIMSCCISTAVCIVMLAASMSGIALGYNYSLAEFIDLKETNVSVYLKRGVFDDQVADDMDWRRSGHLSVAGHIDDSNLKTGAPADDGTTTLRAGRRLDDSVFDADDQNRYEGSLMKLTAKPPYQQNTGVRITDDLKMADAVSKHPMGSLDQMKAIQSLIDSRRAMGTGATTISPLATYGSREGLIQYLPMNNNPNEPGNPDAHYRRVMGLDMKPPILSPARFAVPDESIGSRENWLVPKNPKLFDKNMMPDYYVLSPTYPSAVTLPSGFVRPSNTVPAHREAAPVVLVTMTIATTEETTTKSAVIEKLEKDTAGYKDRFFLETGTPKNEYMKLPHIVKSSEEDYEDEIKGLPVRKRRSVKVGSRVSYARSSTEGNTDIPISNNNTKNNSISRFSKNISTSTVQTAHTQMDNSFKNNVTNNIIEKSNDSHINIKISRKGINTNQHIDGYLKSDQKVENIREQQLNEYKEGKSLLKRLITIIQTKEITVAAETTPITNLVSSKPIRIKTRRRQFESKIVSSKYVPNKATNLSDKRQTTMNSNKEILNSISVSLNEAGMLRNPSSSTFIIFLQSTLT